MHGWPSLVVLLIAASTVSCVASIRPAAARFTRDQCVVDPAIVGTWTDRRMTQLGPAWVKETFGCDCTHRMRAQLLWLRVTGRAQYRAVDVALVVEQERGQFVRPYALDNGTLRLTEAPGEVVTLTRSGRPPACASDPEVRWGGPGAR